MTTLEENLTKAAQCAELLESDVWQSCKVADEAMMIDLLGLVEKIIEIKNQLNAMRLDLATGSA